MPVWQERAEHVPLVPVVERRMQAPAVRVPQPPPWVFAAAMALALAIAATAGIGLAVLAALEQSGPSNWTAVVQGHGRIQLFSFAAVFVAALSFEFIVRLNGRPALPVGRRLFGLALIGIGALVLAAGQLAEGRIPGALVAGGAIGLAGAVAFFVIILSVRPGLPVRRDAHPLFFRAAAMWLVVASILALAGTANAIHGIIQLPDARAVNEVLLRGFVLNTIFAVALRALPGHLGVPPLPIRRQFAALIGANAAVAIWMFGSGASIFEWSDTLMRAGDVLLAVAILAFTWWSGLLRAFRLPAPDVPRFQTLIPLAWLGAVAYAMALLVFAFFDGAHGRATYQEGAIRHIFVLGFMAPLMIAFAHIVLARFGTGRFPHMDVLTLAFALLFIAWPMRVTPALFTDAPPTEARNLIAVSGVLAAVAFGLAAFVCAATARHIALAHRKRSHLAPAGSTC